MSMPARILAFDVCLNRQRCNVAHMGSVGMLQCNNVAKNRRVRRRGARVAFPCERVRRSIAAAQTTREARGRN
jgi:hypothetical protein